MPVTISNAQQGPPYSVHAEKMVLASMILNPSIIKHIHSIIPDATAFYSSSNERIFNALIAAPGKYKPDDSRLLIESIGDLGHPHSSINTGTLLELSREGVAEKLAEEHARVVAGKAKMRLLVETVSDILTDAYRSTDGFEAVLQRARSKLDDLADR